MVNSHYKNANFGDVYRIYFSSLTDLYNYIKSDPEINYSVFSRPFSLTEESDFHGKTLDISTEYIILGYNEIGLKDFLKANNKLKTLGVENRNIHSNYVMYGGVPLAPLVAAGAPNCMLKYNYDENEKYVNIYFSLCYPADTTTTQIINRGLSTLYIVRALEEKGYIVNFTAFELAKVSNELVNIEINLKKPEDLFFDVEKCYYPFTGKEFLRRVLFRVLESVPVTKYNWGFGYGKPLDKDEIKKFYGTSSHDLIISYPADIGIKGIDLYDDLITLIQSLNLTSEFDIDSIRDFAKNNGQNEKILKK